MRRDQMGREQGDQSKTEQSVQPAGRHTALGRCGEDFAAALLKVQGYKILRRNYRCPYGEIDLIAQRNGHLLFAEVKTRRSLRFGRPAEAVDRRKQQRIRRAAASYLQEIHGGGYVSYGFQVIEIYVEQIQMGF